ncbi:MAG: C10 family peptidase [Prevotella sp.]|nr:C10 family peptidase [Prevotella sp.]
MKRISTLFMLLAMGTALFAAQISQKQAMEQARSFINKMKSGNRAISRAPLNVEFQSVLPDQQLLYAFNIEDGGFVIVSGDDHTVPILGYSLTGTLDADNIPDNMRSWLKACELGIAAMKHSNGAATRTEDTSLAAIEPMLKTTWYQAAPYNLMTPIYNGNNEKLKGKHGATGCTATAMAQVMYYHQWPKEATQPVPEYPVENDNGKIEYIESLPATTFKWDKMLLHYDSINPGTEEEQLAVAELMNYCGRALKMEYAPNGSGTLGPLIANAVRRYFDYSKSTRVAFRQDYSIDGWRDLLWNELKNNRPVPFSGATTAGGHSFVIDGYDGKGLFHVNWGWDGRSDGYFVIGQLDPQNTTSIGAASVNEAYVIDQTAIIGMEKSTGTEEVIPEVTDTVYLAHYPTVNERSFGYAVRYYSYDLVDGHYYFGWGEKNADGTCTPFIEGNVETVIAHSKIGTHSTSFSDISNYNLKDGTYKIYPMAKLANKDDATWKIIGNDYQCLNAAVKDSKVEINIPYKLAIIDAYFKNPDVRPFDHDSLYVIVENQGDIDVSMFAMAMWQDVESASGSTRSASTAKSSTRGGFTDDANLGPFSLRPGERDTLKCYIVVPPKGNKDICLTDDQKETIYDRKTMTINNDFVSYDVEFTDYRIEYAADGKVSLTGTLKNNDTRNMLYDVSFSMDDGTYYSEDFYSDYLAAGSSVVLEKEFFKMLNVLELDPDDLNSLLFTVEIVLSREQKQRQNILTITVEPGTIVTPEGSTPTGIKAIQTREESDHAAYYDLQGRRIGQKPQQKGVYIYQGKKTVVK